MTRPGRAAVVLAAGAVATYAVMAVIGPLDPGETIYVAGVGHGTLLVVLVVVLAVLVLAALVCAGIWAGRRRTTAGRWGAGLFALLAVLALLPLGYLGSLILWGAGLEGTYDRFDAPDGTAYLLRVATQESGMLAVYESAGVGRWRLLPSFGERYVIPGYPPCHGEATATDVVVRCRDGKPSTARR